MMRGRWGYDGFYDRFSYSMERKNWVGRAQSLGDSPRSCQSNSDSFPFFRPKSDHHSLIKVSIHNWPYSYFEIVTLKLIFIEAIKVLIASLNQLLAAIILISLSSKWFQHNKISWSSYYTNLFKANFGLWSQEFQVFLCLNSSLTCVELLELGSVSTKVY